MFVELAKPVTLLFCMLALIGVFHSAFLMPASDVEQRLCATAPLLSLAAGISLVGGLIFREAPECRHPARPRIWATLPVQVFCWASSIMLILFLVSWYLEAHCIFYRDTHFY